MTPVMEGRISNLDLDVTLPEGAEVISKVTFAVHYDALQRMEQEIYDFQIQVHTTAADLSCQRTVQQISLSVNLINVFELQYCAE